MIIRCRLGLHDFHWPRHQLYGQLWTDEYIDCWRGCGARTVRRCHREEHWTGRHEEITEDQP